MSRADVLAKYRENAVTALGASAMQALEAAVMSIDSLDDVSEAFAPLAQARAA